MTISLAVQILFSVQFDEMESLHMCNRRLVALSMIIVLVFSFCSCGNSKYWDMKRYLNSNTEIGVISIDDWIYNEQYKSVLICITLPRNSNPSLKELDGLRRALNDYMQKDGGYLEQGWQVSIYVDEQMTGSAIGTRYAVFANFDEGRMGSNGTYKYATSKTLNTFWFRIDFNDIAYISSLNDVEHVLIGGRYNESDSVMMYETIEAIKELDDLKSLKVYSCWYSSFYEADLKCEIIEINDDSSSVL